MAAPAGQLFGEECLCLRREVPGYRPDQLLSCSLAEWMWNSAIDCFLRTNWATVAVISGYPLYRMHHQSPGAAVNMLAEVLGSSATR